MTKTSSEGTAATRAAWQHPDSLQSTTTNRQQQPTTTIAAAIFTIPPRTEACRNNAFCINGVLSFGGSPFLLVKTRHPRERLLIKKQ